MQAYIAGPPGADRSKPWQRLAVFLWLAILSGSCIRCLVGQSERDVGLFSVYSLAGRHFLTATDLYPPKDAWNAFLYSPTIAALLVPYSNQIQKVTGTWDSVFIIAAIANILVALLAIGVLKSWRARVIARTNK